MRIRAADDQDIPALHALIESAYRGDSAKRGWTHEADLLAGQRTDQEALAAIVADPKQTILVGEGEDGNLIGCVLVADKGAGIAYLGMLTVSPDLQAGGLGRALIDAAEEHARGFGAATMEMTVIKQRRELIDWYTRRGYRETGREEPFPLDDPRFGLPKTRDLVFVVLEKRLPSGLPKIRTDLAKLNQILFHLLDNAAKFTRRGRVELELALEDGQLLCSVTDTGIGIAPDDQEQIFDEFYRVDSSPDSRHRGAGLGLTLARALIEKLGGALSVQSEIGQGSRFSFSLPVAIC